ncbi:MAG: hypothetical protein C4519_07855 [Desulfobacteraceae bacterium]|nr:MAG: hypothetical protein C4519_07855 [Desulfobacteraceae bacterium]
MGFNPLQEKGIPLEKQLRDWSSLNVKPYDKNDVHPYTRCRIIIMNGAEIEGAFFGHQFARHCDDIEIKRNIAMCRRVEQQQQKVVNWLVPANESPLEVTIGYEQVAVDLTAALAKREPHPVVKAALDFALLEDFDHLYRYANLLQMTKGIQAGDLVGKLTEITVGRPTISEHRHPFDEIRSHYSAAQSDIVTKLNVLTIVAAEQQTMNFYMNIGNRADTEIGRALYQEIAQIEEQHVTHYESLADPTMSWFMRDVLHQYSECYLYHSFIDQEPDERIRKIWEMHLDMEIGHLKASCEMMKKHEKRDPAEFLPDALPAPLIMESNIDYVRQVMAQQTDFNARGTEFVPGDQISSDYRYFDYQKMVNADWVPSQELIRQKIGKDKKDYRLEIKGPHPVKRFQKRDQVVR